MPTIDVVGSSLYRALILHSSNEPSELSLCDCHDDSTINIDIIIVIIITAVGKT